ncbi:MAG: hypothetical protein RMK97_07495 [Sutterellaceae bacterium]|nr:hypothetical protein [Burkholderiaceae bacterium]MDW8430329.1 hypothetical protein [Sutterellaceae bacterium]
MNWLDRDFWELASYIVTALGLPLALFTFIYEQRKERANEEEEVYQMLSNAYTDFLKVVIDNPDLHLTTRQATADLTPEQRERMLIIFDMLMSLFERAYLTAWKPRMNESQRRRWAVWEDFMREWLRRDDFYANFERLLIGEDPDFVAYIRRLAEEERGPRAVDA